MDAYGYFSLLNRIAHGVDSASKEAGFKSLVECDMLMRSSLAQYPEDFSARTANLVGSLKDSLYPTAADFNPTIDQRMMIVEALLDSEIELIVLDEGAPFNPHYYSKHLLVRRFGLHPDEQNNGRLRLPYFLRKALSPELNVFVRDDVPAKFGLAIGEEDITPEMYYRGLFPVYVYGKGSLPAKLRHLPLS